MAVRIYIGLLLLFTCYFSIISNTQSSAQLQITEHVDPSFECDFSDSSNSITAFFSEELAESSSYVLIILTIKTGANATFKFEKSYTSKNHLKYGRQSLFGESDLPPPSIKV